MVCYQCGGYGCNHCNKPINQCDGCSVCGEWAPEYSEARKKTTFCREYDGESLHDISRDIYEAFDERFNPVIAEIPVDKHGFQKGVFRVTIDWYSE